MKLSTKGRYGLRAMVDIAVYSQDSPVPISAIAERQNISVRYLEQLLPKLKKAGIIKSIRGAQGGYMLDKDPKDISAGDIFKDFGRRFNTNRLCSIYRRHIDLQRHKILCDQDSLATNQ